MSYLKINNVDLSQYVSALKVAERNEYNYKVTASGRGRFEYKFSKRIIEAGIIPLSQEAMEVVLGAIKTPTRTMNVTYLDPETNELVANVPCYLGDYVTEYYTIQESNTRHKAFTLKFNEI